MAEAMKDSKTRWLGQIPADWDMVRVKDCFDRKNKKANQKDPVVLSLARSGVKIRDISSNEGQLAADYTNYNPVAKDDILINPMDLVSGDNCNISRVEGVISPAYVNLRHKKGINPRFYNYYFKLQYWLGAFFAHGFGVSFDNRWTLSYETLSKYPLILPPSSEQDKIADFLDEKCAEIDKLSEDIKKQIDILNNYKKSVITRAVTKGLDPNVEMKDSGVVAIGDIPSTWKLCRIKNLFIDNKSGIKVGPFGSALGQALVSKYDGEYKVYGQANLIRRDFTYGDNYVKKKDYERLIAYKVLPGDIAVSMMGTIGKCMVVPADIEDGIMDSHLIKIRLKKVYNPNYFEYLYESDVVYIQLLLQNKGSIMTGLNSSIVKNIYFLEPPVEEQNEIVNYLDDICSKINSSIRAKNEQIVKMDAYKKSIIYEYVTGKKRVKGAL